MGATSFLRRLAGEFDPVPMRRSWLRLEEQGTVRQKDVAAAIREVITGLPQEVVIVVGVDSALTMRTDPVEVARGTYHSVVVPMPAVLAVPLLAGCDRLIVAHNHPSGALYPSKHDYAMTKQIAEGANAAGLVLHDHLIYDPDGWHVSMRDSHVLEVPEPTQLEVQA